MREQPPPQLIALLENLGLATAAQVHRMSGRVGRLPRDLPRFESVWVDALAQQRILTPLQAAEINAGRGHRLRIGPYVLCESLPWPHYAAGYRARRVGTDESVRLTVVESQPNRTAEIGQQLQTLLTTSKKLQGENLCAVDAVAAVSDGEEARLWAASPWTDGRTAAEWMIHDGRFPPQVVLEIARAMIAGLVELERIGSCHGDISASGLVLTPAGNVVLLQPGLRGIVRPEEGYAHADLLPEAFDYLAPERISDGTGPSIAGDIYACGCLWWHLLCGRPPLSGGSSLEKLRWAQAAKIVDPRRYAPEVPTPLGTAISACLRREPSQRPESMARLAAVL
ncbi:MAG TPA: protein kinase, partial [Thermoguttaceae bacterium]|nr:protein kinase [Thermoguttaceae bacterium]